MLLLDDHRGHLTISNWQVGIHREFAREEHHIGPTILCVDTAVVIDRMEGGVAERAIFLGLSLLNGEGVIEDGARIFMTLSV